MRPREAAEVESIEVNDPIGSDPDGIEAGSAEPICHRFDLVTAIGSIADRYADAARAKGISLTVKTADSVPEAVLGDERRIDRALSALLDNAVRFTDEGEIVASVTCENALGDRTVMHVEVSDTGRGIPDETLEQLFDSGARGVAAPLPAGAGGLLQSQRIVELLDGRFGCCSELGTGTTMWFSVPLDLP